MAQNKLENIGLELDQIIGGPLMALVKAEEYAAEASADFIRRVGFNNVGSKSEWGQLATVSFKYKKSVDGNIKEYEVNVPVLSLVPIPMLQIEKAELEFSLRIAEFAKTEINKNKLAGIEDENKEFPMILKNEPMTIKATISSSRKSTSTYSQREMRVKMNLVQSDLPAGIARLSNLLDSGITEVPVKENNEKD